MSASVVSVKDEFALMREIAQRGDVRPSRLVRWSRSASEGIPLLLSPVFWGVGVPRGDDHAVLVLGGYNRSKTRLERRTEVWNAPLRIWLRRVGYRPVRAGQPIDGWYDELICSLVNRAEDAAQRTGRKISIVGHSLGGLLARRVAVDRPDLVRHVMALGAPLAYASGVVSATVAMTVVHGPEERPWMIEYPGSRENHVKIFEVDARHNALAANPQVYGVLGSVLRQGAEDR